QDCPLADLTDDCRVDVDDLFVFGLQWLDIPGGSGNLDGLGGVDIGDFVLLAADWGTEGIPPVTLVINEFMADNKDFYLDPAGEDDDWIEIYNYGDTDIDMAGMYLSDDLLVPDMWMVPYGKGDATIVPAGGYLLIWADNDTGQEGLHATFGLGRDGNEDVGLFDSNGKLVDSIADFGPQLENHSLGRFPNGQAPLQVFGSSLGTAPTPGKANSTDPADDNIVISEIMYHPYHDSSITEPENIGEEYIELYNKGAATINLQDWRFADGIDFVFPLVTLNAGECLVVAADLAAFQAKYPAVSNVVAGWTGHLSNSGERIVLSNSDGRLIDDVRYSDEGDWSERYLGPVDEGHRGWLWSNAHDGDGKSIEVINFSTDNDCGQNWGASTVADGTPGVSNSIASGNIAPVIEDVEHSPIIPKDNETVVVTASVSDDLGVGPTVKLHWRVDASGYNKSTYPVYEPATFTVVDMYDDGMGGGVFSAEISAHPEGTIIEFFIEAGDGVNVRTWPAPADVDGGLEQVANCLYQVYLTDSLFDPADDWTPGRQPLYNIIMTNAERGRIQDIGDDREDRESNAQMNATFISVDGVDTKLRYNCGVRNRGHGTRDDPPNNFRVNFRQDDPWKGVTAINLNDQHTYLQYFGHILFKLAGLPSEDPLAVQLRINGVNDAANYHSLTQGSYVHLEAYDTEWAGNHFPDDPDGNLYGAVSYSHGAELDFLGWDPTLYNKPKDKYAKNSNSAAEDWSDLIDMTYVLDVGETSDEDFINEIDRKINVDQWLRWFAIANLMTSSETNLGNGSGDDYFMYFGTEDRRCLLLPHDQDSVLTRGGVNDSIWLDGKISSLPVIERFLEHPRFTGDYYGQFRDLFDTVFAADNFNLTVDRFLDWVDPSVRSQIKSYVASRETNILSGGSPQIPASTFTIQTPLPESPSGSGYYRTTAANLGTAEVYGAADVFQTRSVTVNGVKADWDNINGDWSVVGPIPLNPGINRVAVEAFDDPNGIGSRRLEKDYIDIWYDDSSESTISGAVATRTLDAASGPWHVTGSITVGSGVTLTIDPGTTLFFDAGVGITVNTGGRLVAEGTRYERIMLTRVPGSTSRWGGITLDYTLADNRLCYVDMEFGDSQAQSVHIDHARLLIDHMSWNLTSKNTIQVEHPSLIVQNSALPNHDGEESIHGEGLIGDEYLIVQGNTFGIPSGYQDVIDFSDCKRPGPILQVYDNVFLGGGDDALDLDDTDAHIEGNLFMNFASGHTGNDGSSTANAVATDAGSDITIARNIFIGGDHHILLKNDVYVTAQNNVFIGATMCAINFGEPGRGVDPGEGAYLEGNIFLDNAAVFHNIGNNPSYPGYGDAVVITVNNSIISSEYVGLGNGNMDTDPQFVDVQNDDYHLQNFSPAIGTGPLGLDMGAYVPAGATISGEPAPTTWHTDATLTVGGPGITHYKYSLISSTGPWSAEFAVASPIALTGLVNGQSYTVYVLGKNSADVWQSEATVSDTWTIDTSFSKLIINEVKAHSHSVSPDLIELYYDGPAALDMTGMSITDNPGNPRKFVFEAGTTINPGEYKVLIADPTSVVPGHLNFAMTSLGDELYLYDAGGSVIDSVEFGMQWNDWSIGLLGDGQWHLNIPTLGAANVKQPLGDPAALKINEWLANGDILFNDDFIELYNPGLYPVSLGELYLSDNDTQPLKSCLGPLSFIEPNGYAVFRADGGDKPGHVNFKLNSTKGTISLSDGQGNVIDQIVYRPQTTDYSQGRSPDGAETLAFFGLPTPWLANDASGSESTSLELVAADADVLYKVPTDASDESIWMQLVYDSSSWQSDVGALGFGEVFTGGANSSQWQAFNDCQITPLGGTQANVTTYSKYGAYSGPEGGPLKDFATGSEVGMPTVTFTSVATLGTSTGGAADNPASGTDAYNYFFDDAGLPIVDFDGNLADMQDTESLTMTFSGLNPNATYNFIGSVVRSKDYPTRITLVTISGHDSATPNSSISGDTRIQTPTEDTALLQAGNNSGTGYVVGWTNIVSGPDGSFAIFCERYSGSKAYPIAGFLLEQLTSVAGPLETAMVGNNASLYVRTEFELDDDPAEVSSLTLKMQYDDGFIAFLNGVEVASDNFGLTRAWNSQADSDRADGLASSYVDFDISAFKANLVAGTNVLAIQGLNNSPSDPNFLVQAKLEAVITPVSPEDAFANAVKIMDGLRITELMYNPSDGAEYEFIELQNISGATFDISGVRFTDGIDFTFPAQTELAAGGFVVLAADRRAFALKYPTVPAAIVFGPYDG
ncbi:MAG: lamin tail domain-containing protein, partial [Planctomycetes bacterium]|nr:lamin tail domain-containing protein [Planctomycetota bacterium]